MVNYIYFCHIIQSIQHISQKCENVQNLHQIINNLFIYNIV